MNWAQLFVKSITAAIIAGGGVIMAANEFTDRTWIVAGTTALLAGAKDMHSQFGDSPKK